jgi:hypothetical protein
MNVPTKPTPWWADALTTLLFIIGLAALYFLLPNK